MRRLLQIRVLSALALGVLVASISLPATEMILCIGVGADLDCCPEPGALAGSQAKRVLDRPDCDCCVAVDAALSTTGAASQELTFGPTPGPHPARTVAAPPRSRGYRAADPVPDASRLSSLRTVVLLI